MPDKDSRHRFILEKSQVRGVLVRLDDTWREVLQRAEYPLNVRQVLGHAMAAMPLLTSMIKFTGKLTLQARGSGPVTLLVVQGNADGGQRGLTLTIQIESSEAGDLYQGVVQVTGESLQDALADYFENSEQLPTRLWLACTEHEAAGFMLQQLPVADTKGINTDDAAREDDWHRVNLLAETIEQHELLEKNPQQLLRQVFAEHDIRVFESEPLRFECGCSRERTAGLIAGIGYEEATGRQD